MNSGHDTSNPLQGARGPQGMPSPGFTRDELMAEQSRNALGLVRRETEDTLRFTVEQRKLILQTCCGGASEQEAMALIAIAEQRGLNPITQECYFVNRYDSQKNAKVWSVQASIDAMRIKAEESGLYDGQDEPEFEYNKEDRLILARVRVYRKDWSRPAVGVARYDEYEQTTKEGKPTRFWERMPHNQLAKCAEALAMRKAFPKRFSRIYTPEEMAQASNDALPAHDAETGEVHDTTPAHAPEAGLSKQLAEMHLPRICAATTLDALKRAGEAIKADADRLAKSDTAYLRSMARDQKARIVAKLQAAPTQNPDAEDAPL